MKAVLPAVLGIPAGELSRLAGLPSWLVIVVVAASLVLGLVRAIFPQDSADRLHLLLALRGRRTQPENNSNTPVTGHVMDDQQPEAPAKHADSAASPLRKRELRQ
jgi:hypothetical protein